MNTWDRMLVALGSRQLKESLLTVASGGIDPDDALYRPLTERGVGDLDAYTHDKMLNICLYLDRTNAASRRMLDLIRYFVFGEGLTLKFQNRDVEAVVNRHWNDPINRWDRRGPRLFRQLLRDGEVLVVAGVNSVDGMVRWGSLPSRTIEHVTVDPNNWEIITSVTRKRQKNDDGKTWSIISQNLQTGHLEGEALFWVLNDDGRRGISFLYPLADLLDAMEETIYNDVERQQLLKSFLIDVTVNGADDKKIAEMKRDPMYATPKPGSVWMHNENIENKMIAPDLRAYESVAAMKFLLNFIVGSAGIPFHWFGFGGDANRATAATMDEPVIKMLTYWQDLWVDHMDDVLRYVIDQAVIAGTLPAQVERQDGDGEPVKDKAGNVEMIDARDAVEVVTPDMDTTDIGQVSTALQQVAASLMTAVNESWISDETAQQTFWLLLSHLGVDVDPAQEQRLLQQADQARQAQEQSRPSIDPATQKLLTLAMAGKNGNGTTDAPHS
jgi:hypothetical protein